MRTLLAALALSLVLAACSQAPQPDPDPDPDPIPTSNLTVATSGGRIDLLRASGDEFEVLDTTTLPDLLGPGIAIFGLALHPSQPWLATTAMTHYNWGAARIDLYAFTDEGLDHVGTTELYDVAGLGCADGGLGGCAITELVFHPDGTRLYVNEDNDDVVITFSVNTTTGALTFLEQGPSVWQQGLTVHPTAPYLYNGTTVLELVGGLPQDLVSGDGGNSTTVFAGAAGMRLLTTIGNGEVRLLDLTDPAAPVLLDDVSISGSGARALAVDAARERAIVVGTESVAVYSFTGDALTELSSLPVPADPPFSERIYRGVSWMGDGTYAAGMWFTNEAGGLGGYTLFHVDAAGVVSVADEMAGAGRARATVRVP